MNTRPEFYKPNYEQEKCKRSACLTSDPLCSEMHGFHRFILRSVA